MIGDEILEGLERDGIIRIVERRDRRRRFDPVQVAVAGLVVAACLYLVVASVAAVFFGAMS